MSKADFNVSIQSGHLSSPQQQSVTPIQLQQQQQQLQQQQQQQQAQLQQQQQQQPDPTKSIQWQISTSSSSGGPAHPQNVNKVGPVSSGLSLRVCVNKWKGLILSGNFFLQKVKILMLFKNFQRIFMTYFLG